jgi:hypothetical protein
VARIDENRNIYITFIWKPEGRRGLVRPNIDGNIEIDVK